MWSSWTEDSRGGLPADEDEVPLDNGNGNPLIFDFFGLGQHGQAPFQPQPDADDEIAGENDVQWDQWVQPAPDAAPAAQGLEAGDEVPLPDLNIAPLEVVAPNLAQPIPALGNNDMEVMQLGPLSLDFGSSMQ